MSEAQIFTFGIAKYVYASAYDDIKQQLATAQAELSETKDYCNSVWELVKMFIPMCPAKSIVIIDKAMNDGKALREKYKSEVEKERDALRAEVKELELSLEIALSCVDPDDYNKALKDAKEGR